MLLIVDKHIYLSSDLEGNDVARRKRSERISETEDHTVRGYHHFLLHLSLSKKLLQETKNHLTFFYGILTDRLDQFNHTIRI